MALNNVIIVPSTGNAATDGASLATALSSSLALGATAASPVVVRLDAGTYSPSAAIDVPAFVSLVGSGIVSTTVTGTVTVNKAGTPEGMQTISNMTFGVDNSPGTTLTVSVGGNGVLTMDHIQTVFDIVFEILYPGGQSTVTITNSLLLSYSFPVMYSAGGKFTALVVATSEVYTPPVISPTGAPVKMLCTADWSTAYPTPLSSTCVNSN